MADIIIMNIHPEVEKWLKANFNVSSSGDVSGSFNLKSIGSERGEPNIISYSYKVLEIGDLHRCPINAAFQPPYSEDSATKLTGFLIPNEGYTKLDPPIDLDI
jgi:hypothetical protein